MKIKIFQNQKTMSKVLLSLFPLYLFAIYLYGLKLLILTPIVFGTGLLIEFIMEKLKRKKVSEAVLVTCTLYLLSLPPDVPIWIAVIGISIAVFLGKEVFGGFGRNPFNPAIAGRLFVYITFPNQMGSAWLKPGNFGIDAVSTATPLTFLNNNETINIFNFLFGFRSGAFGESMVILIILAAIYLIVTKTASWRIILSTLISGFIISSIFFLVKIENAINPVYSIMSGSFLFVTVFMATDPVSAPKNPLSQFIYGTLIGTISILIRMFSLFTEGTSFAILIANTFAMLLDEATGKIKNRIKV